MVEATHTLVLGLVMSHFDYVKALFIGMPECKIAKLQCMLSLAEKLVLNKSRMDSTTEAMKLLPHK